MSMFITTFNNIQIQISLEGSCIWLPYRRVKMITMDEILLRTNYKNYEPWENAGKTRCYGVLVRMMACIL